MKRSRSMSLGVVGVIIVAIAATVPWIGGLAGEDRRSGSPRSAVVKLHDTSGASIGEATLNGKSGEVEVDIAVSNLVPGFHGFHVHAIGVCDAASGFTTAGGHLNTAGAHHPNHAADMPVLFVKQDGSGATHFVTDRFNLGDLFDSDGSALVIHAAPDNYANIPARYAPSGPDEATLSTGDAGPRAACGVVKRR